MREIKMRRIKFRVWDKAENEFSDISEYDSWNWFDRFRDPKIPETLTIQQSTGLLDDSDVEIYEGDILHYVFDGASYPKEAKDEILTCLWVTFGGMYSFENKDSEYYWAEIANRCSVVGNIFENPELLEK